MSATYQPIDCDFYDRLEAWATRKQTLTVTYFINEQENRSVGIIKDLYVRDHVEYMLMSNGQKLRLDTIKSVYDGDDVYHLDTSCQV